MAFRIRYLARRTAAWRTRESQVLFSSQYRTHVSGANKADVSRARAYCLGQLVKGDYEAHLITRFLPRHVQSLYAALRCLNLELVRLPDVVSNPTIGRMRLQFWLDSVDSTLSGRPPREPICILLHSALEELHASAHTHAPSGDAKDRGEGDEGRTSRAVTSVKYWVSRFVRARSRRADNRPFPSLSSLEDYAETTYATLMYATLAALPVQSVHADHLASHIGKSCGIVAALRGIPVLSAPSAAATATRWAADGVSSGPGRQPALLLPLDVMAEAGVREEDVFRMGPAAPGLQDAVLKVATRAHDHLLTARQMVKSLRAGQGTGHEFEHSGDAGHAYGGDSLGGAGVGKGEDEGGDGSRRDLGRAFDVLLEAVPAGEYLGELERRNFDPFATRWNWKLPWKLFLAARRQDI